MDWNDVRLFLHAARTGSVRRAAHAAHVDASTISRRLAALERAAGARLFERRADGLHPTTAGREMLESAARMEGAFQQLDRRVAGSDRNMAGVVRLTLPLALGDLVVGALGRFLQQHTRLDVELQIADALLDLDARQADVAVRAANEPPPTLVGKRVARLAVALYASADYLGAHPAPLEDVAAHRWIEWDRRYADKPAVAWVERRYPGRRIAARGSTTVDVVAAVAGGLGIGGLPCVVGDARPGLVRIEDGPVEVSASVWVLTHRDVRSSARVRATADWVTDTLREARPRIEGRRPA